MEGSRRITAGNNVSLGNKASPETVPFEESIKAKRSHNQRAWVGRANQTNGRWRAAAARLDWSRCRNKSQQ